MMVHTDSAVCQVEKMVGGRRQGVGVTGVDPHLTTWYGEEVSCHRQTNKTSTQIYTGPAQFYPREGGGPGLGVR